MVPVAEQHNILQGGQAVLQALAVQHVRVALPLRPPKLQFNFIQPALYGSILLAVHTLVLLLQSCSISMLNSHAVSNRIRQHMPSARHVKGLHAVLRMSASPVYVMLLEYAALQACTLTGLSSLGVCFTLFL